MKTVLLLRHGPTSWNADGRIQGRTDLPLAASGRARVRAWRLPPTLVPARWLTSPLRRARETATLLAPGAVGVDERLVEMDWGAFEGQTLAALRAEDPAGMAANEARGLDFRPPGGESPRDVQARLEHLLHELADGPTIAVAHKGVIRAGIAFATGWNMQTKPPLRMGPDDALELRIEPGKPVAATVVDLLEGGRCGS